ncbi:MAG TPA: ATP-dependent DNA ligase [Firmicutes bacterium]|nr:ATP-dependent DNA ligase [Bacillota bacterium]
MLPLKIAPMLAVSAPPFDSPDYHFELKWDGIRCLAFLTATTRLQSRNGREISFQYPELDNLHRQVKVSDVVLDGEIIALADGKPSFFRLQSRMHTTSAAGIREASRTNPVLYVAFDLLYLKGESLMNQPLATRQELLHKVVNPSPHLMISTPIPHAGTALFKQVAALGLEGVVGKDKNSPYLPGKRSPYWKKARVVRNNDFVICGYTTNPQGRPDLSAILVGLYAGKELHSYGLVGTGFSQSEINHLLTLFAGLKRTESPLAAPPMLPNLHWLEPRLVCEVEYLAVTPDRHLRHPRYKGLRNRPPAACRVENLG